jgi:hypothetical protein
MSPLDGPTSELASQWSKLRACWNVTSEKWNDEVANAFAKKHWEEWERELPAFLAALENLDEVVGEALNKLP